MSKRIREGDLVMVISGAEKGKTGEVMSCRDGKALVRGINMRTSYMKKSQQYPEGKLLRQEAPIYLCKLQVVSESGKPVKLRARFNEKGEKEFYYVENNQQVFYRAAKSKKK